MFWNKKKDIIELKLQRNVIEIKAEIETLRKEIETLRKELVDAKKPKMQLYTVTKSDCFPYFAKLNEKSIGISEVINMILEHSGLEIKEEEATKAKFSLVKKEQSSINVNKPNSMRK